MNRKYDESTVVNFYKAISKLLFCFLFYCCQSGNNSKKEVITQHALMLKSNIPIIIDGKLNNNTDSLKIFYYKNLVIYQIPIIEGTIILKVDKAGNTTSHQDVIQKKGSFRYFVYDDDSTTGYEYMSHAANKSFPMSVDSFLRLHAFKGNNLYNDIYKNVKLITFNPSGYTKGEQIIPLDKPDETYPDSVYLYFQDQESFYKDDYALSVELDSLSGAKLVKSRFIYTSKILPQYPYPLPAKEFWFEIKPIQMPTNTALIAFFEKALEQVTRK